MDSGLNPDLSVEPTDTRERTRAEIERDNALALACALLLALLVCFGALVRHNFVLFQLFESVDSLECALRASKVCSCSPSRCEKVQQAMDMAKPLLAK